MTALNLKHQIMKQGGITVNGGTVQEYMAGYQVSTPDSVEITSVNLSELLLIIDILELDDFGMWYDDGIWYLDTDSIHTDTLESAQAIGRKSNQKAVYEWSTGDDIKL